MNNKGQTMEDVIFRLPKNEKRDMKIKVALLGFSIQDYLHELVKLDKKRNLIKAKQ